MITTFYGAEMSLRITIVSLTKSLVTSLIPQPKIELWIDESEKTLGKSSTILRSCGDVLELRFVSCQIPLP